MKKRDLVPWNWFNNIDISIPSIFKNKDSLSNYSDRNIDHVFDNFIKDFGSFENLTPMLLRNSLSSNLKVLPRVDISDTDKEYIIESDLPGIKEKDLDISVSKDGLLTIKGKRENIDEQKTRNYYKIERSCGSFERMISLPQNCDNNKVDASFQNGVLSVNISKKEPSIGEVNPIKITHKKD